MVCVGKDGGSMGEEDTLNEREWFGDGGDVEWEGEIQRDEKKKE